MLMDCQVFITLVYEIVSEKMNAMEKKIFHRRKLLDLYESALVIFRRATTFLEHRRPEDADLRDSTGSSIYDTARQILALRDCVPKLAMQLYIDCDQTELDVFDFFNPMHMELLGIKAGRLPELQSLGDRVNMELRWLEASQRCAAPTCLMTAADGRLRLCLGCRRMSYCSRRCQKRAWTHSQVGHRTVCVLFSVVEVRDSREINSLSDKDQALQMLKHVEQLTLLRLQTLHPGVDLRVE
jgi:hypothetical protein